jgi:hypothetical protein
MLSKIFDIDKSSVFNIVTLVAGPATAIFLSFSKNSIMLEFQYRL